MEKRFSFDGFDFVDHFGNGSWEVYWNGFLCVDGTTEEEVKANWPRNKQEIINQRLEQ